MTRLFRSRSTNIIYQYISKVGENASKYHNQKIEYYDPTRKELIKFDSIKERDYYLVLKDRERRGEISQLSRQYPIEIQPSFETPSGEKIRAIVYYADFVYYEGGKLHIIDVKGYKTEVYKLKKKLLAYQGFYIEEV